MEIIEVRTGVLSIFALALAWFFLVKYAHSPVKKLLDKYSHF